MLIRGFNAPIALQLAIPIRLELIAVCLNTSKIVDLQEKTNAIPISVNYNTDYAINKNQ